MKLINNNGILPLENLGIGGSVVWIFGKQGVREWID
jgi:hypothetical protein